MGFRGLSRHIGRTYQKVEFLQKYLALSGFALADAFIPETTRKRRQDIGQINNNYIRQALNPISYSIVKVLLFT